MRRLTPQQVEALPEASPDGLSQLSWMQMILWLLHMVLPPETPQALDRARQGVDEWTRSLPLLGRVQDRVSHRAVTALMNIRPDLQAGDRHELRTYLMNTLLIEFHVYRMHLNVQLGLPPDAYLPPGTVFRLDGS